MPEPSSSQFSFQNPHNTSLSFTGRLCLVTGSSGFIGYHVTRLLTEEGAHVRVLVRHTSNTRFLDPLGVEKYFGDVTDIPSLQRALEGADYLFHVAGLVIFGKKDATSLRRVNVQGVRNILGAAQDAKVKRIIVTSSVAAIGGSADGKMRDETSPWDEEAPHNSYACSKHDGEKEAMKFYREGLPVVVVNPSFVIGAPDYGLSVGGQFVKSYAEGKMKAYLSTGFNVVDVKDVAKGHLLAALNGRLGERYILSNENMMLKECLRLFEKVSGVKAPKIFIPDPIVYWGAAFVEGIDRLFLKRGLPINRLQARALRYFSFFSHEKATRELGYHPRSIEETVEETVRWLRQYYFSK